MPKERRMDFKYRRKQCVLSRKREDKIPMNIADDIKFHVVIYSENNGPKRFDEEIMPIVNETCPHIEGIRPNKLVNTPIYKC